MKKGKGRERKGRAKIRDEKNGGPVRVSGAYSFSYTNVHLSLSLHFFLITF